MKQGLVEVDVGSEEVPGACKPRAKGKREISRALVARPGPRAG